MLPGMLAMTLPIIRIAESLCSLQPNSDRACKLAPWTVHTLLMRKDPPLLFSFSSLPLSLPLPPPRCKNITGQGKSASHAVRPPLDEMTRYRGVSEYPCMSFQSASSTLKDPTSASCAASLPSMPLPSSPLPPRLCLRVFDFALSANGAQSMGRKRVLNCFKQPQKWMCP